MQQEENRARLLKRVSLASVCVALLLAVFKLLAWWVTGSVAVLASVIDSVTDVLASTLNFIAVRFALLKADDNHHFGHAKAEHLSALAQGMFIAGSSVFLLISALAQLWRMEEVAQTGVGIFVMGISLLATIALVWYQKKVLQQVSSASVEADTLHYFSDVLANVGVLVGLVLVALGWRWADGMVGLIVAGFMLRSVWQLLTESVHALMDKTLPAAELAQIEAAISSVSGHQGAHRLRARRVGEWRLVDMHLAFPDELSLYQAHAINDEVENAIASLFDEPTEVMIHLEPASVAYHDQHKLG